MSDSVRAPRFRDRLLSVRARITAAVIVLTALSMAGAGGAVYVVESARLDRQFSANISQELEEFATLQGRGINPRTGEPFDSTVALLDTALERNVPGAYEALVAYWDGRPRKKVGDTVFLEDTPQEYDFYKDPSLDRVIDASLPQGGSRVMETAVGSVLISIQPVTDGRTEGAFAVVMFSDRERIEFLSAMRLYAVVASIALLLVAAGAWFVAGRLLRPVRDLRTAAQEISDTDLTRRIEARGNDDLTDLTLTFNAMLDRLEEAFGTQRQFLDDAGHELRTPITIIHGHLELLDPHDVDDVEGTRALVLDEIDRMARLVEDLMVLAKAKRPGFVVPDVVDVARLTEHVAEKVRGLGDRRWSTDSRGDGLAVLDSQRITQALVQLASNAVRYTAEQDSIALGSDTTVSSVRFWVQDTGAGIDPAELEHLFERFHRGSDDHRSEGLGLGLSIVAAIAEAHGGTADVRSAEGRGTTFVLTLPRKAPS